MNYRRQSEDISLFADETLDIQASFDGTNIYISIGLVLAIEDISMALLADPQTSFGKNSMEAITADRLVYHHPTPNLYDINRYINYESIIRAVYKQDFTQYPDFLLFLFKFLSQSTYRQEVGELVSVVSLYWIISHEDAHNYLGHTLYSKATWGISPDDTIFSELIGLYSDKKNDRIRRACEIEADTNASMRLIDHIVDGEFIEFFPILTAHEEDVERIMSKFNIPISKQEVHCIILLRLCIISSIVGISIFERNVVKNNSNREFYPDFMDRVHNITDVMISRTQESLRNRPDFELVFPTRLDMLSRLIFFIIDDLNDIFRTIFFDSRVMEDLSVAESENMKRVRDMLGDFKFSTEFFEVKMSELFSGASLNISLVDLDLKYKEYFSTYYKNRIDDIKIWISELSEYRVKANPQRKAKIEESIKSHTSHVRRFEKYLSDIKI